MSTRWRGLSALTARPGERPWRDVPAPLWLLLAAALAAQLAWRALEPLPTPRPQPLPPPPPAALLRALALGDATLASYATVLWLQAREVQSGVSLPWRDIDYHRLAGWLDRALELDPDARYPLLAAARVYAAVADPPRQRVMLEFVHRHFLERPAERWQWLAHAVYVARHRLHDERLALRYAESLARHTRPGEAPSWARQMHIFVRADLGEVDAARVLLGALLASGEVTDPNERRFLARRLAELEARASGADAKRRRGGERGMEGH